MGWTRSEHVRRLAEESPFDVLVVGGGATGVGTALDLSVRGARVALAERHDFAQGTSSRSTKLLHGGIRYLPHLDFGLVSEGLREQKVLARVADFLYRPLEFVVPLFRQHGLADAPSWAAVGRRAPVALRAGLLLYDLLGGTGRPGRRHRRLDAAQVAGLVPSLRADGLTGGFAYSDGQTDDARLVLTVAKTAVARYGAVAAPGVEVVQLGGAGDGFEAVVRDRAGDATFAVRSRAVLLATGAFPPPGPDLRIGLTRSKGVHLVFPQGAIETRGRALVLPETEDGRVLFVIPWLGHPVVGTTDTPYEGDLAHPRATEEDVDYLLRHLRRYLDLPRLEPLSAFAGLRALVGGGAPTARASREHVVVEPAPGYVRVAGGKLTTYRRIAAEAADRIARLLGLERRSRTDEVPLMGSGGDPRTLERRLVQAGLPGEVAGPVVDRYGTEAERVARLVEEDPRLAEPLADGRSVLAEVVHAVREEAASRISDFTLRRTHVAWFTPDHGRADARRIAEVMAADLSWPPDRLERELAAHEAELTAEGL